MGFRRGVNDWDVLPSRYTEGQIEHVLSQCGVEVASRTMNDFLCYCPYHGNRHTPSMSVSKGKGSFICFNASCAVSGEITDLIRDTLKLNEFQTARLLRTAEVENTETFAERIKRKRESKDSFQLFDQEVIDRMETDFWNSPVAVEYMTQTRGFDPTTLREYHIGYSAKQNMLSVPMYDVKGRPIGVIGRTPSATDKAFKNSRGLPTSRTLWNIHKAKRLSDTVIVCEASFDAMRISQAGYPNVVACLGGNFSDHHAHQLEMYFSRIVIMTDFDDKEKHRYVNCRKCLNKGFDRCQGHNPGRALGQKIATTMTRKTIEWAAFESGLVYPHHAKDASDMTDSEIAQCIKNSVSNREYTSWGLAA